MGYTNQTILLASMHEKERAIAPPFLEALGCQLRVMDFDTDRFGTFTGEVPRTRSPFETCVMKAKTAATIYGYDLVIASEGSFGPHPAMPFIPCDHEIMILLDTKRDRIIAEQLMSEKTNFRTMTLMSDSVPSDFLHHAGFPEHALTVQTAQKKRVIAKGIQDTQTLHEALTKGFQQEPELLLATDMRAMMNPTRMELLGKLADQLVRRIRSACPGCGAPGFGYLKMVGRLSCAACHTATHLHALEEFGCVDCSLVDLRPRADGLVYADPGSCPYCNP